jgi:hypothetical protein
MKKILLIISLLVLFISLQAQIIRTYPFYKITSTAKAAYTDDFQSYSEGSLNGQGLWVILLNGFYVSDLSGDKRVAADGSAVVNIAEYNNTFANDQYSQITVDVIGGVSDAIGLMVRLSGTGATTCGYGYYAMNGTQRLFRIDNGVKTNLGSTGTAVLNVSDVLRLEIIGTTLTAYRNGAVDTGVGTKGVATVTEYISGKAGLSGYNASSTKGDLWLGGDL